MNSSSLYILPPAIEQPDNYDPYERLFRHEAHPEWGIGLWVREDLARRHLCFQDGHTRCFKKGYYHLLQPVDSIENDLQALVAQLSGENAQANREIIQNESKQDKSQVMTFAQQLLVFNDLFPKGFLGTTYTQARRVPVSGKPKKSQHAAVSEQAKKILAPELIKAHLEEGRTDAVHASALEVLRLTDMVPPSKYKMLKDITPDERERFVGALFDLLYGEDEYQDRFGRWLDTLASLMGQEPSWPLATALPALVHPDRHVVVWSRIFSLQDRVVGGNNRVPKLPSKRGYRRARHVALSVKKHLEEKGRKPADLLDISTFSWETLRPKGQSRLQELIQ